MPDTTIWGIFGVVALAFINAVASVLMLWIRARYHYNYDLPGREVLNGRKPIDNRVE